MEAGLFFSTIMIVSFLLQVADTVLKETIFLDAAQRLKGGTVDLFVVNSFGSAFQEVFICLLLPFLSNLWGIPFNQWPSYLKDGCACFLNVGTLSSIFFVTKEDEKETMEDWDQETLANVVVSKSNEYNKNKPTDIVCKHFVEAVEKKQYGWFWVFPNGGKEFHYRHALPPRYVLKSQMKAVLEEKADKLRIEEEIENITIKILVQC